MLFGRAQSLVTIAAVMLAILLVACASDEAVPASTAEPAPAEAVVEATPSPATPTAAAATPSPTEAATVAATTPSQPEAASTELSLEDQFASVEGIVDPTNFGWPRTVEGLNGAVSIPGKPQRIITASIGHDEMTLALVPVGRLVGVGVSSKDPTYSNVSPLVQDLAEISRDPETIVAESPDVIVTSPYYPVEGIEALMTLGIPVVQTQLENDPEARINSILLMGYIYGEEARAIEFAMEVRNRYGSLVGVTADAGPKPRVLALTEFSDTLWVAGADSTEGGVIEAAGGINAAAEAGIEGNQTTSLEGVIAMNPEVIVIPQPVAFGAEDFLESLFANEALAEVPAVRDRRVHIVDSKLFTTLSHWNILGAEQLAWMLWPGEFPESPADTFSAVE